MNRLFTAWPRLRKYLSAVVRPLLPRAIVDYAVISGKLRGAKIFTSWHDYPGAILGTTERPLLRWFYDHVRPGETWLDVGAHYGYTALALARLVGPTGRVFAFEPIPATAAALERTRAVNALHQLTIVPLALHDQARAELRLPSARGMADSTLRTAAAEQTIAAVSLDECWPQFAGANSRIDGIKIDVQGMELQVLGGMLRALESCAPRLIIEFHRGVDRAHALRLLASAGYSSRCKPIDPSRTGLEDDSSYLFEAEILKCASSSTRSITARN